MLSAGLLVACTPGVAQPTTTLPLRPAVRPVPPAEILWRKTLWRLVDLREALNQPLFVPGHELGSLLVAAVRSGEMVPYQADSVDVPLPLSTFNGRLRAGAEATNGAAVEYTARQLSRLDVREDVLFDKRHGRMVHEFRAVTLVVPANESGNGLDWPVASFRYDALIAFFRAHPATAIWRTPAPADSTQAASRPLNLAVAFDRVLYHSYLYKVSNPDDVDAFDVAAGDPRRFLALSHQTANWLNEFEYRLWNP